MRDLFALGKLPERSFADSKRQRGLGCADGNGKRFCTAIASAGLEFSIIMRFGRLAAPFRMPEEGRAYRICQLFHAQESAHQRQSPSVLHDQVETFHFLLAELHGHVMVPAIGNPL